MKATTAAVYNTITSDHANMVAHVVRAEWEMNRFFKTLVDNTPSEDTNGYDKELFPIEAISKPNRPNRSGIIKAVVGQSFVEPSGHSTVPSARYYMASRDDEYKYWQSPSLSDSAGNMSDCAPQVLYYEEDGTTARTVPANKISFIVENTYSYPVTYKVQVKLTPAAGWRDVGTGNFTVPATGKVELWYNGSDWTTTPNYANVIQVHGVRLVVTKMYVPSASRVVKSNYTVGGDTIVAPDYGFTKADAGATVSGTGIQSGSKIVGVDRYRNVTHNYTTINGRQVETPPTVTWWSRARLDKPLTASGTNSNVTTTLIPSGTYFNLISLGLNLELDVTSDVAMWNDTFSMGEDDFISPLGTISSNNGSISLFNETGLWSNDGTGILAGILDKNVIFRAWMQYGSDLVQEFEMFSDTWTEDEDSTSVSLVDGTKLFMDTKPRPVLYTDVPVQEAIWRICDIVGFTNYEVTNIDTNAVIDIFWTDGQKTVWEIFSDLSRASQTAIYFDSYGVLQVKTRDAAWDDTKTPVYDFIRNSVPGGQPANIVSLSEGSEYQANKVTVNWKPTAFSERVDNIIPFEVVWEPDGAVVLRSTPLAKNLLITDTEIWLPPKPGKTWVWNGMCQVEGEWISFDAKWYIYYDAAGTRQSAWVESYDDQKKLDAATPVSKRHLNRYTGRLRVKERGLFNTEVRNHYIDMNGWTTSRRRNYGTATSPASGVMLNQNESTVTIASPKNSTMNDYTYLHRGGSVNSGFWYLGTRLQIDKTSHKDKVAGIFFNGDGGLGSGYFLEVMSTARMDGKMRQSRNEVLFYSMKTDGSKKVYGGERIVIKDKSKNDTSTAKVKKDVGGRLAVPLGRMIDFDIIFRTNGSNDHLIDVWANGSFLFTATVPQGSGWQHTRVDRSGLYVRGQSSATFDYFYGINNLGVDPIDGESYYDRIEGAYRGNQVIKDWTYDARKVRRKIRGKWTKILQKYNQRFYDEFGPMVHEIREFKVKFTSDTPVLQSKLYFSNTTQAVPTEYTGYNYGADFIIANISRNDAVISGDDEYTSLGNGTINHKLFVYGRPVIQKDSQKVEKTDDINLRRRGAIELEFDSDWIQNETEANALGDWITSHWTNSDSRVEMEVFGNPLIELGDVVNITYRNIHAKFYVIGVSNTYDSGLSTNLILRKAIDY